MSQKAEDLIKELNKFAKSSDVKILQGFFKTGHEQYGEGDVFIGVRLPENRAVCKKFKELPLGEIQKLLDSDIHEYRLAALIILSEQGKKKSTNPTYFKEIYDLYLKNLSNNRINNWDLVDVSAEYVLGNYLVDKDRQILKKLAKSGNIWQKRASIIATFAFLKQKDASTTLELAKIMLHDKHDLIQKAVGWMLREAGKRVDEQLLIAFLEQNYKTMPRTALRYAIEKLSVEQKTHFMKK